MPLHTLSLDATQHHWVLLQERERLAQALDAALLELWPDLVHQLGPRAPGFVRAALEAAMQHGFTQHRHACYFFALWCVWGASFDSKPDCAWAREVVVDPARDVGIKIQQLVLQTRIRLEQIGGTITPESWDKALAYLERLLSQPPARSWIQQPMADTGPRLLCDLNVLTVESIDQPWRTAYEVQSTPAGDLLAVQQTLSATQQHYRLDRPSAKAQPLSIAVLACPVEAGVKAVLNVRAQLEHVCHTQQHPRMVVLHGAGQETSEGSAVLRRPLFCQSRQQGLSDTAAFGLFAPVSSSHLQVQVQSCGLRLAGAPMRQQCIDVTVWPATQWLADIRAYPQAQQQWPRPSAEAATRAPALLLAVDNHALPTTQWIQAWQALDAQWQQGIDQWMRDVQRSPVLHNPRLACTPNLMHGRSMVTWGMQEQLKGASSDAVMRAQARGQWTACASEMDLQVLLQHEGAAARMKLHCAGQAMWDTVIEVSAQTPEIALKPALEACKVSWRFPWTAEIEALSTPALSMLALEPLEGRGALYGEAGWRLREDGQGYAWYCQVHLEAMEVTLWVRDPLLGLQRTKHLLWSACTLLDWSAG